MAYDFALNRIDHDLQFEKLSSEKFAFYPIEGADRVAQQIKINLLSFLGEWFLDVRYGVPYLEDILIKNPRMPVVETILRQHIHSVPDVDRIQSLSVNWDRKARSLRVDFEANTKLGPVKDSFRLELNRLPRMTPYV